MIKNITNKKLFIALSILLVTTLILTASLNYIKPTNTNTNINITDELATTENTTNTIINNLKEQYNNNDIIGIITIDNTSINEPIAQTTDNDYYLNHTLDKEYDKYGSIYMDYRIDLNNSKKILIFGHNSSIYDTDIVPFKELENYYNENYYQTHKYITLTLENEIRTYEIFSIYVETSDFTYMNLNFNTNEDWYRHIIKLKNKSLYNTSVDISQNDEILILQTCSNNQNYSNYDQKYLLVISKRI